jgi:hypothetical protein
VGGLKSQSGAPRDVSQSDVRWQVDQLGDVVVLANVTASEPDTEGVIRHVDAAA